MKTFKTYRSSLLLIFVGFIFSSNTMSADEEILIATDEKAKKILLGYDWKCKLKDEMHSATSEIVYEEASLEKVTAKVKNSFCPTDWGTLEGKIEEGRVSGKITDVPAPCESLTYNAKIYKSTDGSYYTKDSYMNDFSGAIGQMDCIAVAK